MATHLSAVPAPGRAGTAAPTSERDRGMDHPSTEITKWPWHLTNTDVIVRDPHHPDDIGEWPVIGTPRYQNGCTVIDCETGDGGEGVFVYDGSDQATVRAHATYSAPALLTHEQREKALEDLSGEDCCYLAGVFMQGYPEIFDRGIALLRARQTLNDERSPA
jgi:hypothetical protein